jgi:23S rRNA pseudouridine2605 synthase
MEERLQKIMSHAGLGSRRACEELIQAGRVTVNGRVAEIGQKADPVSDRIVVDGRVISAAEPLVYIALYKPRNVLSAVEAEPHDFRKTVRDLVPVEGHIYPVGRLDFDSEGLVLMTNDGDLTNKLTHPKFGHFKIYRVLVARRPDDEQLATWRRGVVLEDGFKSAPADVTFEGSAGKGAWLRVVMREGRKRQIREIGSLLGLPVVRILRIAIGPLRLGFLKPGDWRHLTAQEVAELREEDAPRRESRSRGARTQRPSTFNRSSGSASRSERSPRSSSGNLPDRKPYSKRPSGGGAPERKPYSEKQSGGDGPERKPYSKRPSSGSAPERKPYSKRPSGGGTPERKPYSERQSGGDAADRKPYSKRPSGGGTPERKPYSERRSGGDAPERKPYSKRPSSGNAPDRKPSGQRPSGGTSAGNTYGRKPAPGGNIPGRKPGRPKGPPRK